MKTFKNFNEKIQKQFTKMCKTGKLFRASISGDKLWETFLSSFESHEIFRDPESNEHNCNCCKNFIRRYGNIVSINKKGELRSIFTNLGDVGKYTNSANELSKLIRGSSIRDVFFETYNELNNNLNYQSCNKTQETYNLGIAENFKKYTKEEVEKFGKVEEGKVYTFNHFMIQLPKQFVSFNGDSIERIMANYRDKYQVFKRAMEEIPLDTLNLVKDLINQGSLLDGNSHLHVINEMIPFFTMNKESKYTDNELWKISYELDERTAKFKNTLIGVLCTELAEGKELNEACKAWNKRVDPANYHKATAPITKRQIAEAQKFVEENNYTQSFNRRLATIGDIKADEIKHINIGNGELKGVSIFDKVKPTSTSHKRAKFENIEETTIENFMDNILPNCTKIEALLQNNHEGNLVVMTTGAGEAPKHIFKWDNPYSWTFNGNLAGKSQIKEAVKTAGGAVDGILRFSIMWADGDNDNSDLDAHCVEPNKHLIYYSDKRSRRTGGVLDIDITHPNGKLAVENITYPFLERMDDGKYEFIVHQFAERGSKGFKAEIEFDGEIYSYEYNKGLRNKSKVTVAIITLKDSKFTIEHKLPETNQTKELWGLETKSFHKVNLVCLTPNHWGENKVGNKHYMFMLDNCKATNQIRSFHNENLKPDLLAHRKVMEVLGATNMIEPTEDHLAGIGFNATVRDELTVRCSGNFNRMLKIKF